MVFQHYFVLGLVIRLTCLVIWLLVKRTMCLADFSYCMCRSLFVVYLLFVVTLCRQRFFLKIFMLSTPNFNQLLRKIGSLSEKKDSKILKCTTEIFLFAHVLIPYVLENAPDLFQLNPSAQTTEPINFILFL